MYLYSVKIYGRSLPTWKSKDSKTDLNTIKLSNIQPKKCREDQENRCSFRL